MNGQLRKSRASHVVKYTFFCPFPVCYVHGWTVCVMTPEAFFCFLEAWRPYSAPTSFRFPPRKKKYAKTRTSRDQTAHETGRFAWRLLEKALPTGLGLASLRTEEDEEV